jgi:hypothetical protein
MRRLRDGLCAAVTAVMAAGLVSCTTSSPDAVPTFSPEPTPSEIHCPGEGKPAKVVWPADFPQALPKPPDSTAAVPVKSALTGLKIVRFSTRTSLRQGVLFLIKAMPKAGFALGRGDAEPTEADAPWVYANLRGTYRMAARTDCETLWLVAVARQGVLGTSPLLPTPTGSPSPLPFAP